MKYFLIAVNTENRIPYGLNANRAVDVRYANRKMAYKMRNSGYIENVDGIRMKAGLQDYEAKEGN